MSSFHTPVMVKEVIKYLNIQPGKWYVDCNLGGSGHTAEILKRGGRVVGIDLDLEAINEAKKNLGESENLVLFHGNFTDIKQAVAKRKIAGVLFDLGVSSYQLDNSNRGFSFQEDASLDMRMDTSTQIVKAVDLVYGLYEGELAELFWKLGEERWAKRIAKKIVESRASQPISTTFQLAQIVATVKKREGKIHPATKVFQALRIAVNDELNNLKNALPKAFEVLEPGGRLVVISFHSLEDKIVKDFFKEVVENGGGVELTQKPVTPAAEEIRENPRARSARMRVIGCLTNKMRVTNKRAI